MKKFLITFLIVFISVFSSSCSRNAYEEDMEAKSVNKGEDYSNEKIEWGLKTNINAAPEVPSEWIEMLRRFDGFYIGNTSKKELYLTFDEGYENGYTGKILDVLKENNAPAAFFITGDYIDREEKLVKRMTDEGHTVGNHTDNHPSMPEISSDEELEKEIKDLDEKYYKITNKHMTFLRPPKGEFSERTLAISKKLGYKTIMWSSAYADWDVNVKNGADYAYNAVMKHIHNGNIILLHAVSEDNANALDKIIKDCKNQGYVFKSLDDL